MTEILRGRYEYVALLARVVAMMGCDPVAYTGRVHPDEDTPIGECALYVPSRDVGWVRFALAATGLIEPHHSHLS